MLPGLLLQAAGLGLVLAYYFWPAAREEFMVLARFKTRLGFGFAIVSTLIFGGLLPWVYLWRTGRYSVSQGGWLLLFWAWKGFEVDLLYRLEARWFGSGHDVWTILRKVGFDQFVYNPVWAVPTLLLFYDWLDRRDPRHPSAPLLGRVFPLLVSSWGVWLPMVAIIYALPTPLQLPLQNLVLCFFTLIVAHQSRLHSHLEIGPV